MSKLSEFINVSRDGQAFVQFENSLDDDQVVSGYIPVKSTLEVFDFLKDAISGNTSKSRAVICWGNYGTGKSRLCTVIARLFKEGYDSKVMSPIWDRLKARGEFDSVNRLKHEMMPGGRAWKPWLVVPIYAVGGGSTINAALIQSLMKALRRHGLDESVLGNTIYQAASKRLDEIIPDNDYIPLDNSSFHTKEQLKRALIEDFDEKAMAEFSVLHKKVTHNIDFNHYVQGVGGIAMSAYEVYNTVAENIQRHGYDGITVIWDEFGFMIEQLLKGSQSGLRNLGQEAMDLQNFIEQSCGGNFLTRHIVFMGFTHVSLSEYGTREDLNALDQNRLDTISGRFRDPSIHIRLGITESEGYHLISGMISRLPDGQSAFINPILNLQKIAERMPIFRLWSYLSPQSCYDNIVAACYPIHPAATTAMLLLSDQIAQQNRTTFYFLQNESEEGVCGHILKTDIPALDNIGGPELLRLHSLFSFFSVAIKENKLRLYEQYEEAIALYPNASELEVKILRTVLILTVIASPDMAPITNMICFCLCDREASEAGSQAIHDALYNLSNASALWRNDATDVWSFVGGRGINSEVEKAIDEQKDLIAKRPSAELIRKYPEVQTEIIDILGDFPLDPGATGIIRRLSIKILDLAKDMDGIEEVNLARSGSRHDLWRSAIVYLVVVDNDNQLNLWHNKIKQCSKSNIYFILPNSPLDIESEKIRDLIAIQNVLSVTQPENHAYDVLEGRLTSIRKELKSKFDMLFGNEGLRSGTQIIKSGESSTLINHSSWNEFFLSLPSILENDYKHQITVRCGTFNEWYIGSSWSAINKIVERIIKYEQNPEWQKQYLGFSDTSQEAAIIDGVLIENNFLTQNSLSDRWELIEVDNSCKSEALNEIRKHFQTGGNDGRQFLKLYSRLVDFPYGIPNGIIPILLALVFRTEGARIGIFVQESGRGQLKRVTVQNVPDSLIKMVRHPKIYSTRYEKLSGKFRSVFKAIGPEIGIRDNINSLGEVFYDYCKQVRQSLCNWISSLPKVIPSDLSENQRQLVKLLRNPVSPHLPVLAEALVNVIEEDEDSKLELNSTGRDAYPCIGIFWANFEAKINRHIEGVKAPFRLSIRELIGASDNNDNPAKQLIEFVKSLDIPEKHRGMFNNIVNMVGSYYPGSDFYEAIVSAICDKKKEDLTEEDYGRACGIIQMLGLLPKRSELVSSKEVELHNPCEDNIECHKNDHEAYDTDNNPDSEKGITYSSSIEHKDSDDCTSVTDKEGEIDLNVKIVFEGEHTDDPTQKHSVLLMHTGNKIILPLLDHHPARELIQINLKDLLTKYSLTKDQIASLIIEEIYLESSDLHNH